VAAMNEAQRKVVMGIAKAWLHVTATLVIAVVIALIAADYHIFELFFFSSVHGGFDPNWGSLALHVGLSGVLWASLVFIFGRAKNKKQQVHKLKKVAGVVAVETLIALVPLLILISGVAQLAMVNVASIISDLAVYQAARTAWIWEPEADLGRNDVDCDDVKFRARTAAAMALAPTAASDFTIGRNFESGSEPPFRRIRTGVAASFNTYPVDGETYWSITGNNWSFFAQPDRQMTAENLGVWRAFDSSSFDIRAGRKVTQAWMSLEEFDVDGCDGGGDEVGVSFTYEYPVVFPWFNYIWGGEKTVATRRGNFVPISREMTLPKQPRM
jgi:hypothetical protein